MTTETQPLPTNAEIDALLRPFYDSDDAAEMAKYDDRLTARAVLAKWGTLASVAVPAQAGEPWYGHKFKEQHRGIWRCECGKTVKETTADWLDMSADELRNLRTETAASTPQAALAGATVPVPWLPYLSDRADGCKGHYAIARHNPAGYKEVWNLLLHKWAAFSDDVLTLGQATELLRNLVIPTEQQKTGVLEDAARWHWMAEYLVGTRTDLDDEIVASATVDELSKLVDAALAARKQGGA